MTSSSQSAPHSLTPAHLTHPKYRPDIDGLRSIAVLSVVIFHAFPSRLPGGFIGVDIFFVISGFLISTIIFKSLNSASFSFADFYSRRIKRIFPALLVVLATTYAFGWHALFAKEFEQLSKHILAGAAFVSNLVFWSEAGYFDNASETKPLLHLWSLGIEEQFYIVWPLLLWLAWRRKFNLLTLTILLVLASFSLNMNGVKHDEVATFYSPQTRFWELLCGSLLAWFGLYRTAAFHSAGIRIDAWLIKLLYREGVENNGRTLANAFSFSGLALLAYGLWRIAPDASFPGVWAVIPVAGAVLIVLAGPDAWLNRNVLSNRVAVWFGLISYPLYLWHWPLLSFARIIESGTPGRGIRVVAVLMAIGLAWFTYRFVEQPIRHRSSRWVVSTLVVLMAAMGALGYYTYSREGVPHRQVIAMNTSLDSGFDGAQGPHMVGGCGVDDPEKKALFAVCESDERGNVRYALMGDSKAGALYAGVVRTSSERGRWLFIGGNGPHGAPIPYLESDSDDTRPLTVAAIQAITANPQIETVVLATAIRVLFGISDGVGGGNIGMYDFNYLKSLNPVGNLEKTYTAVHRVIEKFVSSGKKVVILVDNPALPNPQDCINRKTSLGLVNRLLGGENPSCYVPLEEFNSDIALYRRLLERLHDAFPDAVRIFDATDIYCDTAKGVCGPVKENRLLYSYTDHISDYAAGLVGRRLNEFLTAE